MSARVRKMVNGRVLYGHGASNLATGREATQQLAQYRLGLTQGDWELDLLQGVRWRAILGVLPAQDSLLQGEIRACLLATPGVESVDELTYSRTGRSVTVNVQATDDGGETITLQASGS